MVTQRGLQVFQLLFLRRVIKLIVLNEVSNTLVKQPMLLHTFITYLHVTLHFHIHC